MGVPIDNPIDTPIDLAAAGEPVRRKRGRPPKLEPLRSLLRITPGVEDSIRERGEAGFDASYAAKRFSSFESVIYERILLADESEIGLVRKWECIAKSGPLHERLKEAAAGAGKPKYPTTERALASEIEQRTNSIKELEALMAKPIRQVVEEVYPISEPPPEQAAN